RPPPPSSPSLASRVPTTGTTCGQSTRCSPNSTPAFIGASSISSPLSGFTLYIRRPRSSSPSGGISIRTECSSTITCASSSPEVLPGHRGWPDSERSRRSAPSHPEALDRSELRGSASRGPRPPTVPTARSGRRSHPATCSPDRRPTVPELAQLALQPYPRHGLNRLVDLGAVRLMRISADPAPDRVRQTLGHLAGARCGQLAGRDRLAGQFQPQMVRIAQGVIQRGGDQTPRV